MIVELFNKTFTNIGSFEIKDMHAPVPRLGEFIDVSNMKDLALDPPYKFIVYEVTYVSDGKSFFPNILCRQWFDGNKVEEIFSDEWWAR